MQGPFCTRTVSTLSTLSTLQSGHLLFQTSFAFCRSLGIVFKKVGEETAVHVLPWRLLLKVGCLFERQAQLPVPRDQAIRLTQRPLTRLPTSVDVQFGKFRHAFTWTRTPPHAAAPLEIPPTQTCFKASTASSANPRWRFAKPAGIHRVPQGASSLCKHCVAVPGLFCTRTFLWHHCP